MYFTEVHDTRPRLLIADDNPVVLSVLDRSLAEGFDVVGVAGDGERAVELARASQPDAALIDLEMPAGGGLRAVEGIREVSPETAIVILSIDESDAVVRRLMQAGATAYLRKGVSPQDLNETLTSSIKARNGELRVQT